MDTNASSTKNEPLLGITIIVLHTSIVFQTTPLTVNMATKGASTDIGLQPIYQ